MEYLVLTHATALAYWSCPALKSKRVYLSKQKTAEVLSNTHVAQRQAVLNALSTKPLFGHLPDQLQLLVGSRGDARNTSAAIRMCQVTNLPEGALVGDSNSYFCGNCMCSIAVASPELVFVQMAQLMEDAELAELGCELCGSYALAPLARAGFTKRAPLTTPQRLLDFANAAHNVRGAKRARKVAKWVLANSYSPKESQLGLLAVIPRSAGGYALDAPMLNFELKLSNEARGVAGQSTLIPDLYWPKLGIVVEYDSAEWHEGEGPSEHDSRRRNAYSLMGLECISITKGQFSDLDAMTSIFEYIGKRAGKRFRSPNAVQLEKRRKLHAWMVRGQRMERHVDQSLAQN